MKYEIKNFENQDDQKLVGFKIIDDHGRLFYIDKRVGIDTNKAVEDYISEALAMCQDEIQEWQDMFNIVGKQWNPNTNSFE